MKVRSIAITFFKRAIPAVVLLLLVGFVLVLLFFDGLGQAVLTRVQGSVPGTLTVKRFAPSFSGFTMHGVKWKLRSKEPMLEAAEISVSLRKGKVLKGDWIDAVSALHIREPGMRIVVDRNGSLNLLNVLEIRSDAPAIELSEIRNRITLEGGWILYNDRRDAGFLYEISGWAGEFVFADGEYLDYKVSGAPDRSADSRMDMAGKVALSQPELLLNLGFENLRLEPFAGFPGFGPGLTLVKGTIDGSVRASGTGEDWNALLADLFLVGHLDLKKGAFRSPGMPATVNDMEGRIELLGGDVGVKDFKGKVLDIPFQAGGDGEFGAGGSLEGWVRTPRFALSSLDSLLGQPLPITGEAELDVRARATETSTTISGKVTGYDLKADGDTVVQAEADFLKTDDFIRLSHLEAKTSAGLVSGEGWIFLGEEPRILIDLEGKDADPEILVPGLAQGADFSVKLMGSPLTPIVFGNGSLRGLGAWGQGLSDAAGEFVYSGDNLLLYDGRASKGESAVNLNMGIYNIQGQTFSGVLSASGFKIRDLPLIKVSGVDGQFTGSAFVDADLSGTTPQVEAQAFLDSGDFRSAGLQVTDTSGEFFFDGKQVVIPRLSTHFLGSEFGLSGTYDIRNNGLRVVGNGKNFDLSLLGGPAQRADLSASVQGKVGGLMGVYGVASAPLGKVAVSGFQRENGQLAGVAWVQGEMEDVDLHTTVVANGRPGNLSFEYNGHLGGDGLEGLGPVSLFGTASLLNKTLTIQPTILSGLEAPSDARLYPLTTYRGSAYSFFGPLISGPLEKVVLEESPFPKTRSLVVAGKANLESGALDLGFQLRAAGLEEVPLPSIANKFPFELLSGFGAFRGRVVGNLKSPLVSADFLFPWLMLGDSVDRRLALGARGRLEFARNVLKVKDVTLSQASFDSRLSARRTEVGSQDGLIRLQGSLAADESFDLRVRTEGFSPHFFAFFAPPDLSDYVPSGRFSTDNLHLWGSLESPSVSGRVELRQGGIMVADGPYPITSAFADLASQGGEIRVSELGLEAPGVKLSGHLSRGATGRLSGAIFADDIELDRLKRFGGALSGFGGEADLLVNLAGRFPSHPILELGLRTQNLTWNPGAIGGREKTLAIQKLILGQFDPDQEERLLSGLTIAPTDEGLFLDFEGTGLQFQRSKDGLGLQVTGAVALPTRGPQARPFKTFREMAEYFASPIGPDFGSQGQPFKIALQNLSTSEASTLLGAPRQSTELSSSIEISLLGQWWRDHQAKAGDSLPQYKLGFRSLRVQADDETVSSGVQLKKPAMLSYQREGKTGFLNIDGWDLGFFRQEAEETVSQGSVTAEGRLAIASLPDNEGQSTLTVRGSSIPLANLDFLLPGAGAISGMIEKLELDLQGVLPSPTFRMSGLATNLTIGTLKNMKLEGDISGGQEADAYRVVVGEELNKGILFTFDDSNPQDHSIKVDGEASLFWTRDQSNLANDRLELFGKNLSVSLKSPIDLTLDVIDKNFGTLAGVLGGEVSSQGDFIGKLLVTGTLRRPEFEGTATLANGRISSKEYGKFENLNLNASLNRITREQATESPVLEAASSGFFTRLQIDTAEGDLGGQPFFAHGVAEFAGIVPTLLNLAFTGESLPVKLPGLFSGTVDVDIEVKGETATQNGQPYLQPKATGLLIIPEGTFTLPVGGAESQALSAANPAVPLDVALDISLGKEFFVEAYDARIRAVGELALKAEDGVARLFGQTQLNRGIINIPLYDAAFRVRQGVAVFDGPFVPVLRGLEAVVELGGYRITAQVDGRYPDSLNVELISDPPLPKSELARVAIAGGLPTQQASTDPTADTSTFGTLSNQGVTFLSGLVTSQLTRRLGNLLFLSELTFDYIPPATYAVKIAKALDPNDRFLITVTRIIRNEGLSENLFGVEWRFTRTLLMRLAFDQLQRARFWFQSINRF